MAADGVSEHQGTSSPAVLCSVVIPAHNEGDVIRDRMGSLMRSLPLGAVEAVVVANGCTDDTARLARSIPGLRVSELAEPSKTAALNRGDLESESFPRIYLDADIRITGSALLRLADVLRTERPIVAAPRAHFDVTGSSWPVRAFFSMFRSLPYSGDGLVGLGVYGLSETGRRRFGAFPDVVADDLYVQRLFSADERVTVDATFEIVAPRRVRDLLAVRIRVARGNRELAARAGELGLERDSTTAGTVRALLREVAWHPYRLPGAFVYVGVTALARSRARRATEAATWERDNSSRSPFPWDGSSTA